MQTNTEANRTKRSQKIFAYLAIYETGYKRKT